MDKQQALSIIKQALDQAVKSGVFANLQETQIIANAFTTIAQDISKDK